MFWLKNEFIVLFDFLSRAKVSCHNAAFPRGSVGTPLGGMKDEKSCMTVSILRAPASSLSAILALCTGVAVAPTIAAKIDKCMMYILAVVYASGLRDDLIRSPDIRLFLVYKESRKSRMRDIEIHDLIKE